MNLSVSLELLPPQLSRAGAQPACLGPRAPYCRKDRRQIMRQERRHNRNRNIHRKAVPCRLNDACLACSVATQQLNNGGTNCKASRFIEPVCSSKLSWRNSSHRKNKSSSSSSSSSGRSSSSNSLNPAKSSTGSSSSSRALGRGFLRVAALSFLGFDVITAGALNCSAPNASHILNALDPPCVEGYFIDPYFYCTTQCADGYQPDESVLNCFPDYTQDPVVATLYPSTFYCDADPCTQPTGIENAAETPCGQDGGTLKFPVHGSVCLPQCLEGYQATEDMLVCDAGKLIPTTFECEPKNCYLTDYGGSVECEEAGNLFYHGKNCTPKCDEGYAPAVTSLQCLLGEFEPSSYECYGLPCEAPDVVHGNSAGACEEGLKISHNSSCTAHCAEGYEPLCSDEVEPREGCQLQCLASQFLTTFTCKGKPCESPWTSSIANSDTSSTYACEEGEIISHNSFCTPICAEGYEANVDKLTCSLSQLSPSTFECVGLPCAAPKNIENAMATACEEGSTVQHGSVCTPRCQYGYTANESALLCTATALSPSTFQCSGLPCDVPTSIPNAATPACAGSENSSGIDDGGFCIPQCEAGYEPSIARLECRGSMLRPSVFKCVAPEYFENSTRLEAGLLRPAITRHLTITGIIDGTSLACFRDVTIRDAPQALCGVVEGSVVGLWHGSLVPLSEGDLSTIKTIAFESNLAAACYRDDARGAALACRGIRVVDFDALLGDEEEEEEQVITTMASWHLSLATVDRSGNTQAAILCYQRRSSSNVGGGFSGPSTLLACRGVAPNAAEPIDGEAAPLPLVVGPELIIGSNVASSLELSTFESGAAILCYEESLNGKTVWCRTLSFGSDLDLTASDELQVSWVPSKGLSIASLGAGFAALCYSDVSHHEETGKCVLLTATGGTLETGSGIYNLSTGLTRETIAISMGSGRAITCYQTSDFAGQMEGRCRVILLDDLSDSSLILGEEVVVNSGRTWGLSLSRLFDDTALVCFTDTSTQDKGSCRTLYGPWAFVVGEARVCSPFDMSCVE